MILTHLFNMVAEKIQAKGPVQNQVAKNADSWSKEKSIRGQRGGPFTLKVAGRGT